jgi:lysophospholipase L1-like esterase
MSVYKKMFFACLFILLLVMVTLAVGEGTLRIGALVSNKVDILTRPDCPSPVLVDDLGTIVRGNPSCFDHDARGYRNSEALRSADIVTLGDSWTYGTGTRANAWPPFLSKRMNKTLYNMGVSGTGPLLNSQHISEAMDLRPKLVIYGFYFGNDLFDDFLYTKKHNMLGKYVSEDIVSEIAEIERIQSLEAKASQLFQNALLGKPTTIGTIKAFLAAHSRLYQFLRSLKNRLSSRLQENVSTLLEPRYEDAVAGILESERPYVAPFNEGGWKTIFTAPYRLNALDLSDVRIRTGMLVSQKALLEMNRATLKNNAMFIVVLFPTKEFAFRGKVRDRSVYSSYQKLIENEEAARNKMIAFLKSENIAFIDPLQLLEQSTTQTFRESADSHPNEIGHRLIADAIETYLKSLGSQFIQ